MPDFVIANLLFLTYFHVQVFARITSLIMKQEALVNGISAVDASRTLGVAPAVAKEYLLAAEVKGMILIIVFRGLILV